MSPAASSSEAIDQSIGHDVAIVGSWREGVVVLAMVLAPVAGAIILVAAGVLVIVGWQMLHGMSVALPTRTNLQLSGMSAYVAVTWIDVAAVWFWSQRRRLRREVFVFRRLTWSALAASITAFVVAIYGAPIVTHWLSGLTGGRGPDTISFHDAQSVVIYALLFVVTTPLCEEILYRGLLVAWLRRVGWSDSVIWLTGSLLFGANHAFPLGLVWATVMMVFGAILFALRLRYGSLSPAWLTHFLFNAGPLVAYLGWK
jgi:membrane protease YdiL (CAAX protease family)